jgi:2-succinyl-5-enolpyruvyl-6-hydroxy-3-cyclohexene-1-carboxylate synthase
VTLQQSVPTTSVAQATFVATLVDEWVRLGLTDVVLCPGSRSTPLALAFAEHDALSLHVRIDERSAGFFAIGRALVTRRPVAVLVTSGTAAAELHAAVAEADLAHVPLLILTADRPPELHGVGAPQTIDQQHLYGSKVRLYEEPGVARASAAFSWRPLAQRLWCAARGDGAVAGPVHLNVAFVEPLMAPPETLPVVRGDALDARYGVAVTASALDVGGRRVMAVVGAGVSAEVIASALKANWVVVGDATAQGSLAYADPLVRHDEIWSQLAPDVVVRMGGIPASKFLSQRLVSSGVRVVALEGAGPVADPDGVVAQRFAGLVDPSLRAHVGDPVFAELWHDASATLDKHLGDLWGEELDEILVARLTVQTANARSVPLVIGSSMPVRDVEWWTPSRDVATYANRGANGIDGVVSTFLGVAQGSTALGLVGDVTMLHDVSALVERPSDLTTAVLVVNDNGGGGIFNFLDQARQVPSERFEEVFATARHHDLAAIARAFGHHGDVVNTASQLRAALDLGLDRSGLSVIVAKLPSRVANVARHEELNQLVNRWWAK